MNETTFDIFRLQWLFPNFKPERWTFEIELAKVKKLKTFREGSYKDDEAFNHELHGRPENIEDLFFPMMVKGKVPESREEVEDLVNLLQETGLSTPVFSRHVWDVSVHCSRLLLGRGQRNLLLLCRCFIVINPILLAIADNQPRRLPRL